MEDIIIEYVLPYADFSTFVTICQVSKKIYKYCIAHGYSYPINLFSINDYIKLRAIHFICHLDLCIYRLPKMKTYEIDYITLNFKHFRNLRKLRIHSFLHGKNKIKVLLPKKLQVLQLENVKIKKDRSHVEYQINKIITSHKLFEDNYKIFHSYITNCFLILKETPTFDIIKWFIDYWRDSKVVIIRNTYPALTEYVSQVAIHFKDHKFIGIYAVNCSNTAKNIAASYGLQHFPPYTWAKNEEEVKMINKNMEFCLDSSLSLNKDHSVQRSP